MPFLLSAKGKELTTWRAAEDFAARYRQAVLDRAASGRYGSSEAVYSEAIAGLNKTVETHQTLQLHRDLLLKEVAATPTADRLKELTTAYYDILYQHLDLFHSAPAFYQKSMDFLKMLSSAVMVNTINKLGLFARHLPNMTLMALGGAARCEFSPHCQLQLLMVHDEVAAAKLQNIDLFCHALHDELEATGLSLDPVISPRNPKWRGSIVQWRQRCQELTGVTAAEGLAEMTRLTDISPLTIGDESAQELKEMAFTQLRRSRAAQASLIDEMESYSNGIGIMGGLKLERSGVGRGLFHLQDHGLQPLSSALSALALIKNSSCVTSCERILDLLMRHELDVDLAEKMLEAWHSLHELRLRHEKSSRFGEHPELSLFLDPDDLTDIERQTLKTALASVAAVQRHVAISYSAGWGE